MNPLNPTGFGRYQKPDEPNDTELIEADKELRYLIYNLVEHYQNDHPDPDLTQECRFAIETIEEIEALIEKQERLARKDELHNTLRVYEPLRYATGFIKDRLQALDKASNKDEPPGKEALRAMQDDGVKDV